MKPLADMTDAELIAHIEALHRASVSIMNETMECFREQGRRKPILRLHDKTWMRERYGLDHNDELQKDHDEESDGDWTR